MAAIPRENLDDLLVQLLISNWFYANPCTCMGDFFDPPDPTVGNGLRNIGSVQGAFDRSRKPVCWREGVDFGKHF